MAVMTPMMGSDVDVDVDVCVEVLFCRCRSTTCQCLRYPGGVNAHAKNACVYAKRYRISST